jgi:hypothetical protein
VSNLSNHFHFDYEKGSVEKVSYKTLMKNPKQGSAKTKVIHETYRSILERSSSGTASYGVLKTIRTEAYHLKLYPEPIPNPTDANHEIPYLRNLYFKQSPQNTLRQIQIRERSATYK